MGLKELAGEEADEVGARKYATRKYATRKYATSDRKIFREHWRGPDKFFLSI